MAANDFATMLHKNCHKIILLLVYALLEWILILLLLLNSFFSYLISKFANFFGLKPSCTWCCRLDHVFDSKNTANSHFDHVCEAHGVEISKLSYCTSHGRLAESMNLCGDCSSSTRTTNGVSSMLAFFTWMSDGMLQNEEEKRCSCCDEVLSREAYPPSLIFKPSWDVLDFIHKSASLSQADLMRDKIDFEENGRERDGDYQRASGKDDQLYSFDAKRTEIIEEFQCDSSQNGDLFWNSGCNEDDESVYLADMLLQNADYTDSDRFICIELIDISSQKPLTNSSEDVEEEVNVVTRSSEAQVSLEYEGKGEEREGDSTPSGERVEETDNFAESKKDTELFVSDSATEQGMSHQGLEDCLDGRLIGETEVDDDYLSREEMKARIRAQEEALKALYAELEEERRAAEEAAKETMSMITKLQEEKAAVQIEALQYQRMMEEQAEYDQEALQLLNDLMMKREKEKKELEKELEIYRNKVLDYQAGEKTVMIRRSIDNHSIGINCEDEYDDDDDGQFGSHQEHNLDDSMEDLGGNGDESITELSHLTIPDISLEEFDEERLSIFEELKILEAKLLTLSSDEHERETGDLTAKKLLPVLDAAENENESEEDDKAEMKNHSSGIREELGHVYERLQALEEDKDFLQHCIRSMMKGNQGLALLQEILQHLRDLKSVELSARHLAEFPSSDASMIREDQE